MPRPRTGSVTYVPANGDQEYGHYCARILLVDGSRTRVNFDPEPSSPEGLERARVRAEALRTQFHRRGIAKRSNVPTHLEDPGFDAAWWDRFFALREEHQMTTIRGRYRKYIQPKLAELGATMGLLTGKECEVIRNSLDVLVDAGLCAGDTAVHAWHVLTAACQAASGQWSPDRRRTLKIRETNPTEGIMPPKSGEPKELQWLFPDEFLALMSCERVPLSDRRRYALALYLFCRAGELALLDLANGDLDLVHGVVSIRRAWDRERKRVKLTKTGGKGARRFSIEPTLLPLLRAMHRENGGQGKLVPSISDLNRWAERLREHLLVAGITRPELHATDETRKQMRFHDLRATGLTWLAIRGENPIAIHTRAGHSQWKMTEKYIRVAETVGTRSVGEVFPALPACLLGEDQSNDKETTDGALSETERVEAFRPASCAAAQYCVASSWPALVGAMPLRVGVRCKGPAQDPRSLELPVLALTGST